MTAAEIRVGALKVGVVASEFFDPKRGRIGGFGWAASRVAKIFNESPTSVSRWSS